jgi:hypothetical protein
MAVVNSPVIKLFLDYSVFHEEWKVVDDRGRMFGEGNTPEEAIKSARVVTNAPIYANQHYKGIIDGEPVIREVNANDISADDLTLYGREEIIESLAELGGFKVQKVVEDGFFIGYTMELVE